MSKSLCAAACAALLVVALVPTVVLANSSSAAVARAPGYLVPVYAGTSPNKYQPVAAPTRSLGNRPGANSLVATSTIQVTYHNFSTEAKAAFEAAVNVWQAIVVSDQVIHVDANWSDLGKFSGILGQAGATHIYRENDNFWYPGPLEEARCHCERDTPTDSADITATFNSAFTSWYLGTDGNTPNDNWDLESVVLHELGHGLGFFSSFSVSGIRGYWGQGGYPLRYDANEWSAAQGGAKLISFANGSTTLKTQLTDTSVFLGGSHVEAVLGKRAKLYAPSGWQPGSSNSHMDESKYGPGTINALMTPVLNNGESIHNPGPAVVAILQDIGWTVAGSATAPGAPQSVSATAGDTSAAVSWSAPASNGGSPITGYQVTSAPGGKTCSTTGATTCTVNTLTNGLPYTFTVTATNGVGTGPASAPSNSVVPHAPSGDNTPPVVATPVVNIVTLQVMGAAATVRVSWPGATDDSGIAQYELQRQEGAGPWTTVALATPTSTSARSSLTRGSNYAFRVRATDGVGNIGSFAQTTTAHLSTVQETDPSIVFAGTWAHTAVTGAAGGSVERSTETNATATFTFTGTSVALVTTVAPGRGIAEIKLDGSVVAQVDLYSPTKHTKTVAWASDAALTQTTHTVEVRVTGTNNPSATSPRIDLDAFLVWP
jgi:hypothetical protein